MWTVIFSTIFNLLGYIFYFKQVRKGESNPKSVSWTLWTFLSIIEFFLYGKLLESMRENREFIGSEDWMISLIFFIDVVGCSIIFLYSLFFKKLSFPPAGEWFMFFVGVIAILFYFQFKDAFVGNIIVSIAMIISFYPTIKQAYLEPQKEKCWSWYFCSLAYLFASLNVYLKGEDFRELLLGPVVLLLLHLLVAIPTTKFRAHHV